eukprot:Rmarinus@m.17174
MNLKAIALLLLICLVTIAHATVREKSKITIRPGEGEVKIKVRNKHNSYCHFTYTADGATPEEWMMRLQYSDDGVLTCGISRDQPSYLKFSSFVGRLGCDHAVHRLQKVEVWTDEGQALEGDDYIVMPKNVREGKGFGGKLSKLMLVTGEEIHVPS